MVRSKSEDRRFGPDFVEEVRSEEKYFNCSRLEAAHAVNATGVFDVTAEQRFSSGRDVETRLVIQRRRVYWSAALLVRETRVDGIDWKPSYPAIDGSVGHGWHCHPWDDEKQNADAHAPLPDAFGAGLETIEDFLIRISKEMRIVWSANDVGFDGFLPHS